MKSGFWIVLRLIFLQQLIQSDNQITGSLYCELMFTRTNFHFYYLKI